MTSLNKLRAKPVRRAEEATTRERIWMFGVVERSSNEPGERRAEMQPRTGGGVADLLAEESTAMRQREEGEERRVA
jgi:hypothetical protein